MSGVTLPIIRCMELRLGINVFGWAAGLPVVRHSALASGCLTGKCRPGAADPDSPRAGGAFAFLDEPRGDAVLAALDATASAHDVPPASVALAWLRAQPTVTSPIASARSVKQVAPLAAPIELELTAEGLQALDVAARPVQARARPAHLAPDLP